MIIDSRGLTGPHQIVPTEINYNAIGVVAHEWTFEILPGLTVLIKTGVVGLTQDARHLLFGHAPLNVGSFCHHAQAANQQHQANEKELSGQSGFHICRFYVVPRQR